MKTVHFKRLVILLAALGLGNAAHAERPSTDIDGKVHHLVIIWLKQHGDPEARRKYIEGSKRLSKLPGVVSYDIGPVAGIKREHPSPSVDDSFDVAVSATFESKEALENYSKHPEHQTVIQEVLKPLVSHYKVYDFAD
ncbi:MULTISPECIES: Dabb family protein [Methylomicrobium]|uniref:Stress responsive A/B Barrel Domain-containing protein n=1 Tax=Methylomicrobium album BG8 TaxID=686340 RepID=H8GJK7_METAL|nr:MULTISPECIES: Dabb family protein [Methylomicrobium]EIC30367.1 Stress responsive A/B Barrel Domain-containing protein [Methylomicrobium album BG8]